MSEFLYKFSIVWLLVTGACALICIVGFVSGKGIPSMEVLMAAIAFPAILVWRRQLKTSTKCPKCGKDFTLKEIDSEDQGALTNKYWKGEGSSRHQYEKHRILVTYRCTSCGHELQRKKEKEIRLD